MKRINGMMIRFNRDVTLRADAVYRLEVDQNGMVEIHELTTDKPTGREWTVVADGPEVGLSYPPSAEGVVIYPNDRAKLRP